MPSRQAVSCVSLSVQTRLTTSRRENLSGEIAKKIQDEMTYPGQVKITVIRETRAVSYAK